MRHFRTSVAQSTRALAVSMHTLGNQGTGGVVGAPSPVMARPVILNAR